MCTVVNSKYMPYDVYIGRPSGNVKYHYGNPFTHRNGTKATIMVNSRDTAVNAYRAWLMGETHNLIEQERRQWILDNLHTLKGKTLGCFCKPLACHGDILKELVDKL
jgi:hypothetical protein